MGQTTVEIAVWKEVPLGGTTEGKDDQMKKGSKEEWLQVQKEYESQ